LEEKSSLVCAILDEPKGGPEGSRSLYLQFWTKI